MSSRSNTHRKQRTNLPRGARALALGSTTALFASLGVAVAALPAHAVTVTLTVNGTSGNDANTCFVGSPCKTVQRAIDAAAGFLTSQDVQINVGPGAFTENADPTTGLLIQNSTHSPTSLTVVGAGANQTTLKPTGAQRVVTITGTFPVTIRALTISGGAPAARAAATAPAAGATGQSGGGILRDSTAGTLTLTDVVISGNAAGTGGAGGTGQTGDDGSTILDDNGGAGTAGSPGGAGGNGGGVAFLGAGDLNIAGSTITGNRAGFGGAGGAGGKGGNGLSHTGTDGNGGNGAPGGTGGSGGSGGAISFAGTTLTVTNSTLVTNATGRGGAGGPGGAGGTAGTGTNLGVGGKGGVGGGAGDGAPGGGVALRTSGAAASLKHVTLANNAANTAGSVGAGGAAGVGSTTLGSGAAGGMGFADVSGGLSRIAGGSGGFTVAASILSNQPANCATTTGLTATNTVATDDTCYTPAADRLVSTAAGNLAGLALSGGGTTPTSATTTGNPAIGAVPAAACAGTDQRGQTRPGLTAPNTCTAGAYEPQVPPVAPTISGLISSAHPGTKYGWYRDTVTVTFTCTPGSSPLTAPCPGPMVLSTQGANQGGTVTIANQQGLTSSIKVALNIDKGLPKIAIRGVKKGRTYPQARRVTCVATDSLSGPYVCQVTGTGKLVKGNTQVRVNYTATAVDRAGNIAVKKGHYFFLRTA
ncbi:MAG TPA: choice-of-anchor Q domain-containing protein [Sporichthya sp.]|nr:choice-of-anchor Q domain-containing protein [Sporichthya sp.]